MTENYQRQRRYPREPYDSRLEFIVLLTQSSEFLRVPAVGKTVDKSPAGIGLVTDFPLEAGHVLEWNDQHTQGSLHLGLVKWARPVENYYRAGVVFI
jgi:hypothetical protein